MSRPLLTAFHIYYIYIYVYCLFCVGLVSLEKEILISNETSTWLNKGGTKLNNGSFQKQVSPVLDVQLLMHQTLEY